MKLSVVIATYNRGALLERLLRQLAVQTLSPREFEVRVVDDGSTPPARECLAGLELPYPFHLIEQKNAGQAAARHAGVLAAEGEVLLFVDDDMQVGPDFLTQHLAGHAGDERRVLLGRIRPDPDLARMPFFERWYAALLARREQGIREGRIALEGSLLYTGNVSLRRADYLAVGGFDPALRQSEDCELGLRLEKAGVTFRLIEATTLHGSDHTSLEQWRRRASRYGTNEVRIARKHPELRQANPWRYLCELQPLARPLMGAAVVAPEATRPVATAVLRMVELLDRLGLERPVFAGTTLAYAIEYFRGVRAELGSAGEAIEDLARFLARFEEGHHALAARWLVEVRQDQSVMRRSEAKYGHASPSRGHLAADLIQKIGLQVMAAYRLMRVLRDGGNLLGAKLVSRMIRHLYGSDVHWDAELAPGVMMVHGMGLAISREARVGPGSVLSQGVTLGMGRDPVSGNTGAPDVGADVCIGPGATLLGPIKIGDGTKIMAGAVVTTSVPPRTLVRAPTPAVEPRAPAAAAASAA